MTPVKWQKKAESHDFDAAINYMSLFLTPRYAEAWGESLKKNGRIVHYKAKDILRASQLALLPEDNKHVAADLEKVAQGKALSPILLLRGKLGMTPLIVADGYHRVCASYWVDENTDIPCVIE
jgi:hypothetical protein